jgi:hypothetical protein
MEIKRRKRVLCGTNRTRTPYETTRRNRHMNKGDKFSEQVKIENPKYWCEKALEVLQMRVAEYNQVAEATLGADVVVAFSMTKAERTEFLANVKEADDGGTEDEAGSEDPVGEDEESAGEETDKDSE